MIHFRYCELVHLNTKCFWFELSMNHSDGCEDINQLSGCSSWSHCWRGENVRKGSEVFISKNQPLSQYQLLYEWKCAVKHKINTPVEPKWFNFFPQTKIKSQQQEQQAREHTRYILSMVQLPSTNVLSALTVLGARGSVVYTNGKQSEWL